LVAYLAAARLGAVTTGINARYRRTEIGHILARARPRLLVAVERWHDADFRAMVEALPARPEVLWLEADAPQKGTRDVRAPDTGRTGTREIVQRITGTAAAAPERDLPADAPAAIVFTSGTTGAPKGAWYAHASLLALAEIEARRHPGRGGRAPLHLAAGLSF